MLKNMFRTWAAAGFLRCGSHENRKSGRPKRVRLEQAMVLRQASGDRPNTAAHCWEGTIGSARHCMPGRPWKPCNWGTKMFGPLLMRDDIVVTPLNFP